MAPVLHLRERTSKAGGRFQQVDPCFMVSCSQEADWHLGKAHPSLRGCVAPVVELTRKSHVVGGLKPAGVPLGAPTYQTFLPSGFPADWVHAQWIGWLQAIAQVCFDNQAVAFHFWPNHC